MIDSFVEVGTGVLGSLWIEGPPSLRGARFTLLAPRTVIGRTGDVCLDSALVSRRHAVVWAKGDDVWLRDAGSANGTYVNGTRITEGRRLQTGDRIGVGDVVAVFTGTVRPGRKDNPVDASHGQSETTRYLAAAVHLDRDFRATVLDATVRETHRAVCPSFGVDLSVVARHAVVAERRELRRDAVLTTALGLAIGVFGYWYQNASAATGKVILLAGALLAMTVVAVGIQAWAGIDTLGRFLQWNQRPDGLPTPVGATSELDDLADANNGNVFVFPFFDPFVGSGALADRGSFTVPLIPQEANPDQSRAPQPEPLRSGEVVEALAVALRELGQPQMRVNTRLYVNGYDIVHFPELLPDPLRRPRTHAPQSLLRPLLDQPTGSVRPYLCVEFSSWHGQLVTTCVIRVVALPGVLFIESADYVLPPLKAEYYGVDQIRVGTFRERVSATLGQTFRDWLPALVTAPIHVVAAAAAMAAANRAEREHRRMVAEQERVDYGARTSIREQASGADFQSHFMQQDAEMYVQVVQQTIVDTLTAILDARGFQIDKIKHIQNSTSININNGNQNIGAIGSNARVEAVQGTAKQAAVATK
jgi:hypothetical protein